MSWNAKYVFLILFTTVLSYTCGILLEKTQNKTKKKYIMISSLVLCLAVLFFFKYFNFISKTTVDVLKLFSIPVNGITFKALLPVGISFYTFQTLSYVLDVYRGDITAEKHFGKYAVFVSFFPQLVAGPIERSKNLLPEIKKRHVFDDKDAILGVKIIAWGFFKKLVIADNMAGYVDAVYNNVLSYNGFVLIYATVLFAFQIYCDFSGYSDIAIGTAKLFNIKLMTNFKSPYFSSSLREFWSRWHISLSTWFRDYVYIPLGGSKVPVARKKINLLITFLASGLWHGADWTFVFWGGLHGTFRAVESTVSDTKTERKSFNWLLHVIVIFSFICFAWIFFRANSISDAIYIIKNLFTGITRPVEYFRTVLVPLGKTEALKGHGGILLLLVFDFFSLKTDVWKEIQKLHIIIRYGIYFGLLFVILMLMDTGSHVFVYFQF
jgi:D-alanyl-lipoteichoic acid acyltransferase DltB (MBOAT superfamily)